VAAGDCVAVLRDGRPVAAGSVVFVGPDRAGMGAEWVDPTASGPAAGDTALVLGQRMLRPRRDLLPRGVTMRDEIAALNPGGAFAWIGIGRAVGVETGDRWLVRRHPVPIARAETVLVDEQTALLALTPLVRDLRPTAGDRVALCPSPYERSTRQDVATVLSVASREDRQVLILGTALSRRFHPRDRVELFRDDAYVGHAAVTRADRLLVEAETVAGLLREPIAVGDRAVRRPDRGRTDTPPTARVLRIEGDVCLLTAGERDGIRRGETWQRSSGDGMLMTVENVQEEHCRVRLVRPIPPGVSPPVLWEEVTLGQPDASVSRVVGRLPADMPVSWLAAVPLVSGHAEIGPGAVVRCDSRPPAGALVIHVQDNAAVLYCPQAWRDGPVSGAEVIAGPPVTEAE